MDTAPDKLQWVRVSCAWVLAWGEVPICACRDHGRGCMVDRSPLRDRFIMEVENVGCHQQSQGQDMQAWMNSSCHHCNAQSVLKQQHYITSHGSKSRLQEFRKAIERGDVSVVQTMLAAGMDLLGTSPVRGIPHTSAVLGYISDSPPIELIPPDPTACWQSCRC